MKNKKSVHSTLGLDIGSNSIGWSLIETSNKKPIRIIKTGVRIFPAGVEGDISTGKEVSKAIARREARLRRRLLSRKTKRLHKLAAVLQKATLLPEGDISTSTNRLIYLKDLDTNLFASTNSDKPIYDLMKLLMARRSIALSW